jgi:catechol 2,3-dioxygenase-like lactoylglutathione lyase family enzyme
MHPTAPAATCAVNNVITYAHVADVDASLAFYALLGFEPQNVLKDHGGHAFWARARSGKGEIMLARASGPIDAEQQAVLFYMYSNDVASLRKHLLAGGVRDAGAYRGAKGPNDGPSTVFNVGHPHYMPAGELRIADPDGYVILVGQLG